MIRLELDERVVAGVGQLERQTQLATDRRGRLV